MLCASPCRHQSSQLQLGCQVARTGNQTTKYWYTEHTRWFRGVIRANGPARDRLSKHIESTSNLTARQDTPFVWLHGKHSTDLSACAPLAPIQQTALRPSASLSYAPLLASSCSQQVPILCAPLSPVPHRLYQLKVPLVSAISACPRSPISMYSVTSMTCSGRTAAP